MAPGRGRVTCGSSVALLVIVGTLIAPWTVAASPGPDHELPPDVEVCVAGPHARGAWPSCDGRQAKYPMTDRHGNGQLAAHQLANVFTPATLPAGMECRDRTAAKRVLDLTCLHRVAGMYYHRLMDCVLRNYDWIEAAIAQDGADALVLGQRPVLDLVRFLKGEPWQAPVQYGTRWTQTDTYCVVLAEGTPVYYSSRQRLPRITDDHRRLATRLRARAYYASAARACIMPAAVADAAVPPHPQEILFIHRHGVRALDNADELMRRLALALPKDTVTVYHGNESLADTVCMFARAAAVVGVHGAGHVNALFSRPGTAVLELGPVKHSGGSEELWRTNADVASAHGSLRWLTYALRHDAETLVDLRGRAGANVSLDSMQLQGLSAFHLPPIDLGNIVRILSALLMTT